MIVTLENAINSWRHWDAPLRARPVALKALSGGRSNRSFLLDSDGRRMVLRLNGNESVLPGADRSSEYQIWQAAVAQGISPPLLYVDERSGFLVSAFIENELGSESSLDDAFVHQAFELLKRSHRLDPDAASIDYAGHIEKYWRMIESKAHAPDPVLAKQRKSMQHLVEELILSDSQTGLCHHDPVPANFVGSRERLYLIDWEYAANGLLVMDYAALAVEWVLDKQTIHVHTGIDVDLINMATELYEYLCKLWEAATV